MTSTSRKLRLTSNEHNNVGKRNDPLTLEYGSWDHRELVRAGYLPDDECDDEQTSDDQRSESVTRDPRVLITTSLQAHKEESDANDGQESTDPIDALEEFSSQCMSCWWLVAEEAAYQTNEIP